MQLTELSSKLLQYLLGVWSRILSFARELKRTKLRVNPPFSPSPLPSSPHIFCSPQATSFARSLARSTRLENGKETSALIPLKLNRGSSRIGTRLGSLSTSVNLLKYTQCLKTYNYDYRLQIIKPIHDSRQHYHHNTIFNIGITSRQS